MTDFKTVFSVSQLARHLNDTFRTQFRSVRIQGELASFTRASSGHWYFGLKDADAQVKAVMFRPRNVLCGFVPQMGDQLEVLAQVSLYEPRGELQLVVDTLKKAGQGDLYERFLQVKARLSQEGLFDSTHKKPLPKWVFRVGVVTSLQAAALADVRHALHRRSPHVVCEVHHTPVQGSVATAQIVNALLQADAQAYDAILLVRGGGSLEDLWCFNEEALVRAIFQCKTPIVVGVGHESDVTLAEFAADVRAATPTAAAELVSPTTESLLAMVEAFETRLSESFQTRLERFAQRLDRAEIRLVTPDARVRAHLEWLNQVLWQMEHVLCNATAGAQRHLDDRGAALQAACFRRLQTLGSLVLHAQNALVQQKHIALQGIESRLFQWDAVVQATSPQRTLEKGYAFLQVFPQEGSAVSGQILNSVLQAEVGMPVHATLYDGELVLQVKQKKCRE